MSPVENIPVVLEPSSLLDASLSSVPDLSDSDSEWSVVDPESLLLLLLWSLHPESAAFAWSEYRSELRFVGPWVLDASGTC